MGQTPNHPPRNYAPTALAGILAVAFAAYVVYRQTYIGACDWYGYFQQSLLLQHGHLFLPTAISAVEYPAIVPLGFNLFHGVVAPQYPPGFPLLLTAAGWLNLQFFVSPVIGVLSALCLYGVIKDLTDRWTAVLYAWLWIFFPIVVFGSTTMMSDLGAALSLMASYLAYRRGYLGLSALVLGFGICIRPTNVLYLASFGLILLRDRRVIRYALALVVPAALYAFYNYKVYGAPWRTGYADVSSDLTRSVFSSLSVFYLRQTLLQCSPLLLLLAAFGFARVDRTKIFFLLWFAVYLLFYSFWRFGGDRWWWTRFLAPGFVPLFFLSALGFARLRALLLDRISRPPVRRGAVAALYLVIGLVPFYFIHFGVKQDDLWKKKKGIEYYQAVRDTAALVPAGSYVGSVEFSGSFLLYTKLVSFLSVHGNSPQLVEHVLHEGHNAYLVVEPWNTDNGVIRELLTRFAGEKIGEIPVWGVRLPLYQLHAPPTAAAAAPPAPATG